MDGLSRRLRGAGRDSRVRRGVPSGGRVALGFLYTIGVLVLLVGLALLSVATYGAAILPPWP